MSLRSLFENTIIYYHFELGISKELTRRRSVKIQKVNFANDVTKRHRRYKKMLKRNLHENKHMYDIANVLLTKDCNWTILYKTMEGQICKVVSFNGKFVNTYEFNK